MGIVFLYTELSGYFIACLKRLISLNKVKVMVVHWPINPEAPFDFELPKEVDFINKNSLKRKEILNKIQTMNPSIIVISGWLDKDYLKISRHFKPSSKIVLCMDNTWIGSFKQFIGTLLSKYLHSLFFTHIWIPGNPQLAYAQKLGFKDKSILKGYYSADQELFSSFYEKSILIKEKQFPHRFLFAGRYIPSKGIDALIQTFNEMQDELNGWELWCIGTGTLKNNYEDSKMIKHLGFVQLKNIYEVIEQTGVFILPSKHEPWGVAVHEFASAGLPLVLSANVNSATEFLEEGSNGFQFNWSEPNSLKIAIKKIVNLSDKELIEMSIESNRLSKRITTQKWSDTLINI